MRSSDSLDVKADGAPGWETAGSGAYQTLLLQPDNQMGCLITQHVLRYGSTYNQSTALAVILSMMHSRQLGFTLLWAGQEPEGMKGLSPCQTAGSQPQKLYLLGSFPQLLQVRLRTDRVFRCIRVSSTAEQTVKPGQVCASPRYQRRQHTIVLHILSFHLKSLSNLC